MLIEQTAFLSKRTLEDTVVVRGRFEGERPGGSGTRLNYEPFAPETVGTEQRNGLFHGRIQAYTTVIAARRSEGGRCP